MNDHDLDRFESFHLNSVIQRDPQNVEPTKGTKAIRAGIEPMFKAFPDMHLTIDRAFGQGDWIAVHGHFAGTHSAPLDMPGGQQVPATNRSIRVPYALVAKLEGGKFAETNVYYDQLGFMTQLGLAPQPGSPTME